MNTIVKTLDHIKWYLLAAGLFLFAFMVRAFGKSSKQSEYKDILNDFSKVKRDEILQRYKDLSESVIAGESETIEKKEAEIISIEEAIESRKTNRNQAINSRATSERLEEMGLK